MTLLIFLHKNFKSRFTLLNLKSVVRFTFPSVLEEEGTPHPPLTSSVSVYSTSVALCLRSRIRISEYTCMWRK